MKWGLRARSEEEAASAAEGNMRDVPPFGREEKILQTETVLAEIEMAGGMPASHF